KSDAYGHGMVPVARAALAGGAGWLGVIRVAEALELRAAGLTAPVLCLMSVPGGPHAEAIRHDVDLAAGSAAMVARLAGAGRLGRDGGRAGGRGAAGRAAGPGASQGGHRDVAGRGHHGRLAGGGGGGTGGAGGRARRGRGYLVPPGLR